MRTHKKKKLLSCFTHTATMTESAEITAMKKKLMVFELAGYRGCTDRKSHGIFNTKELALEVAKRYMRKTGDWMDNPLMGNAWISGSDELFIEERFVHDKPHEFVKTPGSEIPVCIVCGEIDL